MSTSPSLAAGAAREARQRALWDRTAAVAGRLNRAQADLVAIAAELIDDGHWGDGGFKSPQHYFVVRAGLSPEHAADVVRVARRRHELTDAASALDDGELSLDQVAVVAKRVPSDYQASLTQLARHATVPQLRRAVARHGFPATTPLGGSPADDAAFTEGSPPTGPGSGLMRSEQSSRSEQRACARAELSMHYDNDGRFQLRYSAPATIGALIEQAVREAKDALFKRTRGSDAEDTDQVKASAGQCVEPHAGTPTYAEGLEEMAHRSLAAVASKSRSSRYRVYLHLSTDGAWVNGGHAIPLRLLGRFMSDGVAQPVWETEGRPVSVGRRMRILPNRTRRLIEDRDRGCRFPGCGTTGFVEIHHLDAWADGGRTDEDRQISLCTIHHDGLDRGDYTISGDPTRLDGLTVLNRYRLPIGPPAPAETAAPPGGDAPITEGAYTPPTGESVRCATSSYRPTSSCRAVARGHRRGSTPTHPRSSTTSTMAWSTTATGLYLARHHHVVLGLRVERAHFRPESDPVQLGFELVV